jgi:hypothetical protein
MDAMIKNVDEFVAKFDQMKKKEKMDLSSDQDLSVAIMNLVGIEEHFFFTGAKTGKNEYYDLIHEVRDIRKNLLKKIVKEPEGEIWCISKHLLAASYRLMEVGTKQLDMGKKDEAYELFEKAYHLYSLFWGLNMKIIPIANIRKIDPNAINSKDTDTKKTILNKLGSLVQKVIDCCIE